MKKLILGLVAAATLAAPLALTVGPASATVVKPASLPAPACVPIKATPAVTVTEYKYILKGTALPLWSPLNAPTGLTVLGLKFIYTGESHVIEVIPAFAGVSCAVTLPQFEAQNVCTTSASATVPFTPHVQTFLKGVQGYPETTAITKAVTVTPAMVGGQFWIEYKVDAGYTATNAGQWHIDFNAPCTVTLPQFVAQNLCTANASATVPFTPHVQTFLYGVTGYDEHVAITQSVTVTPNMVGGQFWIGYTVDAGYTATNPGQGQWHIDFNAPCTVPLPQFEAQNLCTANASVTVPFTPHIQTRLYGVQGYPDTDPITQAVTVTPAMAGQFWIGYTADAGYIASGAGTTHIDFNGSCPV